MLKCGHQKTNDRAPLPMPLTVTHRWDSNGSLLSQARTLAPTSRHTNLTSRDNEPHSLDEIWQACEPPIVLGPGAGFDTHGPAKT